MPSCFQAPTSELRFSSPLSPPFSFGRLVCQSRFSGRLQLLQSLSNKTVFDAAAGLLVKPLHLGDYLCEPSSSVLAVHHSSTLSATMNSIQTFLVWPPPQP